MFLQFFTSGFFPFPYKAESESKGLKSFRKPTAGLGMVLVIQIAVTSHKGPGFPSSEPAPLINKGSVLHQDIGNNFFSPIFTLT